jgi:hypothetical protein
VALLAVLGTPVSCGIIASIRLQHMVEMDAVLYHGPTVLHHGVVCCHSIGTMHANFCELGDSPGREVLADNTDCGLRVGRVRYV